MSTSVSADTAGPAAAAQDRRIVRPVTSRLHGPSRRSVPHLALGALLVVVCATGSATLVSQLDDRTPVLALARPVTVGQQLTTADLQEVGIAADPGVATVPASEAGDVVGSTMVVSLPAGSLLSPTAINGATLPPAGEAIASVALAPGNFPPELSAGARVLVVPAPERTDSDPPVDEQTPVWTAVVVGVHPTPAQATTVVSVQLGQDSARALAATDQVRLVMVSTQDGG